MLPTQLTFFTPIESRMDLGNGAAHSGPRLPTSVTEIKITPTDMPRGQLDLDHSSLSLSSQTIPGSVKVDTCYLTITGTNIS